MEPSALLNTGLILVSYLAGNLSPSILISKSVYGTDIRTLGSGNAGTTNMLRNFGKKAAAATLLIDALKGVPFVLLGNLLGPSNFGMWCGLAVILGHIWPVCFGFKGGKGVATTLGCALAVSAGVTFVSVVIGLAVIALTKRISPGSLLGVAAFPVTVFITDGDMSLLLWGILCTAVIWFKHRSNIGRILKGEEPKIKLRK